MRDRKFAIAKKALIEGTQDRTTIPESFKLIGKDALYGKKGKVHTLVLPASVPVVGFPYGRIEVLGDGKPLSSPLDFEMHSPVRNFYNEAVSQLCATNGNDAGSYDDNYINVKDTSGSIISYTGGIGVNYAAPESNHGLASKAGNDSQGVILGTDDTAVNWETNYVIGSLISDGNTPGQLEYQPEPYPVPILWDGGTRELSSPRARYFDNFNTDENSITVDEMALYTFGQISVTNYYWMIARDILDTPLEIPFRAQAKFTYTLSLVYPSSGSILRNYLNFAYAFLGAIGPRHSTFDDGYLSFTDTGGNIRYNSGATNCLISLRPQTNLHTAGGGFVAAAGLITYGLVVGSDSVSGVSLNDYNLNATIGTGTLTYQASETPSRSWAAPVLTTTHARTVLNGSGGTVTVRESGLILNSLYVSNSARIFMLLHNTFSDVALANGESLRVVYQLKVTYPS